MTKPVDHLLNPSMPESRAPHLSSNQIIGWIPGIVTAINDPEKLGRVRCKVDLIDPFAEMPNSSDGDPWCWVLEDFTVTNRPGGSHRPIAVGQQVALIPMMGSPRQLLVMGCIPNVVDPPHPAHDRSKEKTGSMSANGVLDIKDDKTQSRTTKYPHGVEITVGGDGSITHKTEGNGLIRIDKEGQVTSQNPEGYSIIRKDGTLEAGNKAGAKSTLTKKGEAEIRSKSKGVLELKTDKSKLLGPLAKKALGGLINSILKDLGGMGTLGKILSTALTIAQQYIQNGSINPESFLQSVQPLLQSSSDLSSLFNSGAQSLTSAAASPADEFYDQVGPSVDQALSLNTEQVLSDTQSVIENNPTTDYSALIKQVAAIMPNDSMRDRLTGFANDQGLLTGLLHLAGQTKKQADLLLEYALEGGLDSVSGVYGLGLENSLSSLNAAILAAQSLAEQIKATPTSSGRGSTASNATSRGSTTATGQTNEITQAQIDQALKAIQSAIPDSIAQYIPASFYQSIFNIPDLDVFVSTAQVGIFGESSAIVNQAVQALPDLAGLSSGLNGFIDGSSTSDAIAQIAQAAGLQIPSNLDAAGIAQLVTGLLSQFNIPGLNGILNQANQAFQKAMSAVGGSGTSQIGVIVNDKESVMQASNKSPKVRVTKGRAELKGKKSSVFTTDTRAGVKTPSGTFGIGGIGGSLLSTVGAIALHALQSALSNSANKSTGTPSSSAGIVLNPGSSDQSPKAAIASYPPNVYSHPTDDQGGYDPTLDTAWDAIVYASNGEIHLAAKGSQGDVDLTISSGKLSYESNDIKIQISGNTISIDGNELQILVNELNWVDQLQFLVNSISQLQSQINALTPPTP